MAAAPETNFYLAAGGPNDLDDVMRVMTGAFSPAFGEGWSKSQCAGILPLGGVRLIVARTANGDPAGFYLERRVLDEAELLLLAVDPQYQRLGLGTQLLESFIDSHDDSGVAQLHLEVRELRLSTRRQAEGLLPRCRRRVQRRRDDDPRVLKPSVT